MKSTLDKTTAFEDAIASLDKNKFLYRMDAGGDKPAPYLTLLEIHTRMLQNGSSVTSREVLSIAKNKYSVIKKSEGWIVLLGKTPIELDTLKKNWMQDPCWDIEDTEGFEAHRAELLAFRKQIEAEKNERRKKHENARAVLVREQTGVEHPDIVLSLHTWSEIEDRANYGYEHDDSLAMQTALVRATLLQAAQLKRIADALENTEDGDSLATAVSIWGTGK